MTTRPIDSKREEFRKYLERTGVLDALTKVLVMLYEEMDKPEDALEYVRSNLGDKRPPLSEVEALRDDYEAAQKKLKELEEEIRILKGEETMAEGMFGREEESEAYSMEAAKDD